MQFDINLDQDVAAAQGWDLFCDPNTGYVWYDDDDERVVHMHIDYHPSVDADQARRLIYLQPEIAYMIDANKPINCVEVCRLFLFLIDTDCVGSVVAVSKSSV